MMICGIDPGANGAIAVLDSTNPDSVALLDLNKATMYDAYLWLKHHQANKVWVEDVHSLFGMSAKSNFGFGRNFGIALAIAKMGTSGGPIHQVTPKIWQKFAGVTAKGKDIKKQVAEIATRLYPAANVYGKRGGLLDGRSDALMIAHYGLHYKEPV
jgi:hypothetical protein